MANTNQPNNLVSATLSKQSLQKVHQALETIQNEMDFLVSLTTKQRQSLPKISTANRLFVEKALESAKRNDHILPQYIDMEEVERDFVLFQQLVEVRERMGELNEKITDTQMVAGSEAYMSMLAYYNSCSWAARSGVPGAKTVYSNLKTRFERTSMSNNEVESGSEDDVVD